MGKKGEFPATTSLFIKGVMAATGEKIMDQSFNEELAALIPAGFIKESLEQRLKKLINREKIMLFMKGEPAAPQCGFSKRIVAILDKYVGSAI